MFACIPAALEPVHRHHPRFRNAGSDSLRSLSLADAQLVLAREHGYESWPAKHIETRVIRTLEDLYDPVDTSKEVAGADPPRLARFGNA